VQFSVFSNLFLVAQLKKMINAESLEAMRASKEILANEIGVVFRPQRSLDAKVDGGGNSSGVAGKRQLSNSAADGTADPDRIDTEGTVQGGIFRFEAGHFEWLCQIAEKLGLRFNEIGKRRFGTPSTLFFCDELARLYGSENYAVSRAASYAVENWAAAGFWDELIAGFKRYNRSHGTELPLGFFVWHSRLEAQHARHTQEELEEEYFRSVLDEDAFIHHGNEMLDGVAAFWDGLEAQRRELEQPPPLAATQPEG
jgi:pyrroloquinoline quinone (PQQ) biosynthesis protein C